MVQELMIGEDKTSSIIIVTLLHTTSCKAGSFLDIERLLYFTAIVMPEFAKKTTFFILREGIFMINKSKTWNN